MKYHLVYAGVECDKSSVKTELGSSSIFDEGITSAQKGEDGEAEEKRIIRWKY